MVELCPREYAVDGALKKRAGPIFSNLDVAFQVIGEELVGDALRDEFLDVQDEDRPEDGTQRGSLGDPRWTVRRGRE